MSLDKYQMDFEETPIKKVIASKGRKDIKKMSSKENQTSEVKSSKKYSKTRGEHVKDVIIAVLVTSIIAFGLGVKFQCDRNAEVQRMIQASKPVETTEVKK